MSFLEQNIMFSLHRLYLIVSSCFTLLACGVIELKAMVKHEPSHLLTVHVLLDFKLSFEKKKLYVLRNIWILGC